MARGEGKGESVARLSNQIACIKYTLFCFNIVAWIVGAGLFAFTIFIRAEPGFDEWIAILEVYEYYIGVYILIAAGALVMIFSFLGCCSALMEHSSALYLFIGTQVFLFILTVIGSAILLDYSTMNSSIQPLIRQTMLRFIITSEHPHSSSALKLIQESIGCCGADGPNDYMVMRQPLPLECRDTVTGNAFFNGCVNELTWFLEDKSIWAAIMAMILAAVHTCNAVLGIVLVQALRREEEAMNRR
ncbi:tetraspanin-2A [Anopheles funestus]|uniref:tetraspanin-2A n=1 Tax=Anopheles funestus TaxID=62324 RepID=UPI0020C6B54A|nr:tetraspanin-2A [Anopheles funestus]